MSAKWWWLTFLASSLLFGVALIIGCISLIVGWPMTVAHYMLISIGSIVYGSTLLWVLQLATKDKCDD